MGILVDFLFNRINFILRKNPHQFARDFIVNFILISNYPFIVTKNSVLSFVFCNLSFINSIASIGFMSAK